MRRPCAAHARSGGVLAVVSMLFLPGPAASTQLVRWAFSGGAMSESGGSWTLDATAGEVGVVGLVESTGYELALGFWQGFYRILVTDAPSASGIHYANGLHQNFPNPFAGGTEISFTVGARSPVRMSIYDVGGRRVATLLDQSTEPGRYQLRWDGRDEGGKVVSSGIYFYRVHIGSWVATRKMLHLR